MLTPWEEYKDWNEYWKFSNSEINLKIKDWLQFAKNNLLPLIYDQQAAIQEFFSQNNSQYRKDIPTNPDQIKFKKYIIQKHPIEELLELCINEKEVKNSSEIKINEKIQSEIKKNSKFCIQEPKVEEYNFKDCLSGELKDNKLDHENKLKTIKIDSIQQEDNTNKTNFLKKKKIFSDQKISNYGIDDLNHSKIKRRKIDDPTELIKGIAINNTEINKKSITKDNEIDILLNAWRSDYSANPLSTDFDYPYYNQKYVAIDDEYALLSSPANEKIEKHYDNTDSYYEELKGKEIVNYYEKIIDPKVLDYIHVEELIVNQDIKNEFKNFKKKYFSNEFNDRMCTCKYKLVRKFLNIIGQELSEKNVFLTWGFNTFRNWLKNELKKDPHLILCFDSDCENRKFNILCTNNSCGFFKICANKFDYNSLKRMENRLYLYKNFQNQIGLFTNQLINKGEFIIEFTGEVLSKKQIVNLNYSLEEKERLKKINDNLYLDANKKGNFSRFIQSTTNSNCKMIGCYKKISINKIKFHMLIHASKSIEANEEITLEIEN